MRTLTDQELQALKDNQPQTFRVIVIAPTTEYNLTNLNGKNYLKAISKSVDKDDRVSTLSLTLQDFRDELKNEDTFNNIFKANNQVKVYIKQTDTWHLVFHGVFGDDIARVTEVKNRDINISQIRDLAKILQDDYIELAQKEYSGWAEDVIQEILNDRFGVGTFNLRTPIQSEFQIESYIPEYTKTWDAVQKIADHIGWDLRFKYDSLTDNFRLTFYMPDRNPINYDYEFKEQDLNSEKITVSDSNIRNVIRVKNETTGVDVVKRDQESIDNLSTTINGNSVGGERYMEIAQGESSLIDTAQEATNLAQAILYDLATLPEKSKITPLNKRNVIFHLDIHDSVLINNSAIRNQAELLVIDSYSWSAKGGKNGGFDTTFELSNKVAINYQRWLRKETVYKKPIDPGELKNSPPLEVAALSVNEELYIASDGTLQNKLVVDFSAPTHDSRYKDSVIKIEEGTGEYRTAAAIQTPPCEIKSIKVGKTYSIKVQTRNFGGVLSNGVTTSITTHGKDAPPSDVSWGTCEFNDEIILRVQPVSDKDLWAYEIREDLNWGNDTGLVYRDNGLEHRIKNPSKRTYTFYVKALDRSNNYSTNYDTITLNNPAPPAPDLTTGDITEFFSALWIEVPSVSGDDIEGYNVYVTPSDGAGNPTGSAEVIKLAKPQKITYQAEPGKSFLIEVTAEDSLGEGPKSQAIEATTVHVNAPDIPDGLLEQSKLGNTLSSKIDTAKNNSDSYVNQVIAYPTEEDNSISTTDYKLTYSAGDIYVGTEVETDPNSFFDITDQSDNEITDSNGDQITITDVQDELGNSLLGTGSPTWYGAESGEEIHLILSAIPDPTSARVHYGVKKKLSELSGDALLKKGVTSKQADANLIASIENMRGFAWNDPVPSDMTMQQVESRVTTNEDEVSSNKTSINQNANEISTNATNIQSNSDGISANQTDITQNANEISSNASSIQTNADDISVNQSNITQNSDQIQSNVTSINTVDDKVNDRSIAIPDGAELFHFDETLQSTKQLKPVGTPVATLRPNEGVFGGAVAVEEGTTNLLANPGFEKGDLSDWDDTDATIVNESYHGEYACKLDNSVSGNRSHIRQDFPASEGETYTLSIRAKAINLDNSGIRVIVQFKNSNGDTIETNNNYIENKLTDEWQHFSVTGTAPANTATIRAFALYIGNYQTSDIVVIDNCQLEQKSFATSFVDGSRPNGGVTYDTPQIGVGDFTLHFEVAITKEYDDSTDRWKDVFNWRNSDRSSRWWCETAYQDIKVSNCPNAVNSFLPYEWHTVTFVRENGTVTVYGDGTKKGTGTVTQEMSHLDLASNTKGVLFDELMISDKAHTEEEVLSWHESNAPFYDSRQTEIQQSQVTQLADEYTVKVQEHANGKEVVSGFGLSLEDGVSEFGVIADRFKIYGDPSNPDETATPVFALDTTNNQLYLLADLIADGTITARMLDTGELITDSAQIKDAVITNAKIKDATITDAKIDNVEATKITVQQGKLDSAKITDLSADQITVGADTTYETNYDPSTKETPSGAQSKVYKQAEKVTTNDRFENPNWNFELPDSTGLRPAGVAPHYSSANWDNIKYYDGDKTILDLSSSDNSIGFTLPAFRIDHTCTYRIDVKYRTINSHADGLYIRGWEYDSELSDDKTHIGHSTKASCVQEDSRQKTDFLENEGTTGSWETYSGIYTPTSSAIWVSFGMLNWTGIGTDKLLVDHFKITKINPQNLGDLDSSQDSKLNGIESGADVTGNNHAKDQHDFDALSGSAGNGSVDIDSTGLTGKNNNGETTFRIDTDGNAFFEGELGTMIKIDGQTGKSQWKIKEPRGKVLTSWGVNDPRGLTYDPNTRHLWTTDSGAYTNDSTYQVKEYDNNGTLILSFPVSVYYSSDTEEIVGGITTDGNYLYLHVYETDDRGTSYRTDNIWVYDFNGNLQSKNQVFDDDINFGGMAGLTWDGSYFWMPRGTVIHKIDPSTYNGVDSIDLSWVPEGLAWDGQKLWASHSADNKIYRINIDGTIETSINSPSDYPFGLGWDGSTLWNADGGSNNIYQVPAYDVAYFVGLMGYY